MCDTICISDNFNQTIENNHLNFEFKLRDTAVQTFVEAEVLHYILGTLFKKRPLETFNSTQNRLKEKS